MAAFMPPDLTNLPALLRQRSISLGTPLTVFEETTSTNDEAKRAAKNGAPHGATWMSEVQTAGRGRQGRQWVSPPGENILLSMLARIACPPRRLPLLSLVVGLAARDAVARATPQADVRVKWPNDVVIDGRKVCGILVEAQFAASQVEALIIGVGMNVHTRAFPEEIQALATSVALHAPEPPSRATLVVDLFEALERDLPLVAARGLTPVHARLDAVDALRGHRVRSDQNVTGIAEGIDDEGRLMVRRDDGFLERFVAGEVHLLR
ncbi:biotin--[acetyl-CoA-carboxylase] ligase [Pendulispora brunnea]|uniref:biotin--[biotin carboxyl-carrier protein] ligase n=1 Tax=Pendulispora brunnea TaxID=2905690 RepID=A0ABZ2K4E2_9BACT